MGRSHAPPPVGHVMRVQPGIVLNTNQTWTPKPLPCHQLCSTQHPRAGTAPPDHTEEGGGSWGSPWMGRLPASDPLILSTQQRIKGPPSLLPVTIGSDSHALLCNNKPTVIQTTRRVSCHEPEPFPGPPSSQLSFLSYVFQ